jgi:hypothetical protein
MQAEINADLCTREEMEAKHGQCWDTQELTRDFDMEGGFLAPFVVVRRKADGVLGVCRFRHMPRLYFDFRPVPE